MMFAAQKKGPTVESARVAIAAGYNRQRLCSSKLSELAWMQAVENVPVYVGNWLLLAIASFD